MQAAWLPSSALKSSVRRNCLLHRLQVVAVQQPRRVPAVVIVLGPAGSAEHEPSVGELALDGHGPRRLKGL